MEPHEFWQEIVSQDRASAGPYQDRFPARLPDGRVLFLPIRRLGDSNDGIASLILNQTAFAVEAELADFLAAKVADYAPEVIVGLPTLGLSLARAVAERLGHRRYVALGTSRKFWYDEALSVPLSSITSPGAQKRLYLDPRMLPLLQDKRVCLIDDVISSGTSISAGLDVLGVAGLRPVCVAAAMLQTRRWEAVLEVQDMPAVGVIHSPALRYGSTGWDLASV